MQIKSSLLNNRYFELNATKVIQFSETISYCVDIFKIISKILLFPCICCFLILTTPYSFIYSNECQKSVKLFLIFIVIEKMEAFSNVFTKK